ncbi:hypothetical protein PFISCL1PPCAC_8724, partial [Pristionchus fissidentatus]
CDNSGCDRMVTVVDLVVDNRGYRVVGSNTGCTDHCSTCDHASRDRVMHYVVGFMVYDCCNRVMSCNTGCTNDCSTCDNAGCDRMVTVLDFVVDYGGDGVMGSNTGCSDDCSTCDNSGSD